MFPNLIFVVHFEKKNKFFQMSIGSQVWYKRTFTESATR